MMRALLLLVAMPGLAVACASSPSSLSPSPAAPSAAPAASVASPPPHVVDLDASADGGVVREPTREEMLRAMACDTPTCWQRQRDEHASDVIRAFDRDAAAHAIDSADVSSCTLHDADAKGHVKIVFDSNGVARDVTVDVIPPSAGAVASCLKAAFARVRVPAFDGGPIAAEKSFTLR